MAVDEAILDGHVHGRSRFPGTLRFYSWDPPALSLGRSQPADGSHDPDYLRREGIQLIRRPTGGLAVLHEHERTYSICAPLRREPFPGGVLDTYRRIASALAAGLERLGITSELAAAASRPAGPHDTPTGPACFEATSTHELSVLGRKLIGAAQARRGPAFLQHGSILIDADADRLSAALGQPTDGDRFTDLTRTLGRRPSHPEIDQALTDALSDLLDISFTPAPLDATEHRRATELHHAKHQSHPWIHEAKHPPPPATSPRNPEP